MNECEHARQAQGIYLSLALSGRHCRRWITHSGSGCRRTQRGKKKRGRVLSGKTASLCGARSFPCPAMTTGFFCRAQPGKSHADCRTPVPRTCVQTRPDCRELQTHLQSLEHTGERDLDRPRSHTAHLICPGRVQVVRHARKSQTDRGFPPHAVMPTSITPGFLEIALHCSPRLCAGGLAERMTERKPEPHTLRSGSRANVLLMLAWQERPGIHDISRMVSLRSVPLPVMEHRTLRIIINSVLFLESHSLICYIEQVKKPGKDLLKRGQRLFNPCSRLLPTAISTFFPTTI